jgi:transketolase
MTAMMAQRDAFGTALVDLGGRNERVVALDADLGSASKIGMFESAFPERFFQIGIAEQNMTDVAAGLATLGFIPFTSTFAAFATCRAADQIRVSIAQPGLHVIIGGAYSGLLGGKTGKTHQAIEDMALMRALPNMTVVAPGDGVEVRKAVFALADYDGPAYLRVTRDPSPVVFDESYEFKVGRAVVVREGSDVTIITTGIMLGRAVEAVELLAAEGISAHLLHAATVKPLDVQAVVEAAEKTGLVVTAEEHNIIGGLGGAVAETLGEHLPTPMKRVGVADVYSESAPNDALLEKYGLTAAHLARAARALIEKRSAASQARQ